MSEPLELPKAEIERFCRKWKIVELALFGSAVRDELTPESDLDSLVQWEPGAHGSLWDDVQMREELEQSGRVIPQST